MNNTDFIALVQSRLSKCIEILTHKSKEYSIVGDKLYNFKRAAESGRCTPATALWGMARKHHISIIDMIEATELGVIPSREAVAEKFGDMHNYLLLLEAIFEEDRKSLTLSKASSKK